jgi:hypothetical protein
LDHQSNSLNIPKPASSEEYCQLSLLKAGHSHSPTLCDEHKNKDAIFEYDYKVLAFFIKPVNKNIELTPSKGYGRPNFNPAKNFQST